MFSFFETRAKPDQRDIEQVIFDVAEFNRESDFDMLYALLKERHLFLPAVRDTIPAAATPGQPYQTTANDRLTLKNVAGPDGRALVFAATTQSSPLLASGFVGMDWQDILEMALKLEDVHGVLVQGKTSWVAFDKQRIRRILAKYANA